MGRSKSALRASREKKAASKAAGVNPNKRLAMALKAKGAPRAIWNPSRMSATPSPSKPEPASRKVKAEPYSGPTLRSSTTSAAGRVKKAAIQKVKDELSSGSSSGPTLRSSTASSAGKFKKAAIQKIKDELASESSSNSASNPITVANGSEPQDDPEDEPEPEEDEEPEPEPARTQRTMAKARYADHHHCVRCSVWGWEYPPLHVIEEEEET
ncbi:hypothetical protein N0V85_000825 [Neurospora sp. IMI 360204]|nr:hypothetical protein N0V85_000825 [Neurospora sp. IMI 360204]